VKLSLVIPCYNEEQTLPETAQRLEQVLIDLCERGKIGADSNLWMVDDGSVDRTWPIIESLVSRSERFIGIRLSRNMGHQNALLAGLLSADGDAVISLDADLQDDPNLIEDMVDGFLASHEVVLGVRRGRETDTWFKRWTALRYYAFLRFLGVEIVPNHADYRLLGRRAIDALGSYNEVNLFLRGIIPRLGFRCALVYYDRDERFAGESKYSLGKMIGLAVDGVTSFSAVPLRLIAALGALVFAASLMMSLWVLGVRLFTDQALPGWASITLPIYALGGMQLLCMGVLGEYIAKIYVETKQRPRYHIERIARRHSSGASQATAAIDTRAVAAEARHR
jgi:glycosyltransferase involved in cell wall biosynthesis